ncbi:MAG: hypothetical protein ABIK65_10570 [Candidatus Eisenbacteria bacterium]
MINNRSLPIAQWSLFDLGDLLKRFDPEMLASAVSLEAIVHGMLLNHAPGDHWHKLRNTMFGTAKSCADAGLSVTSRTIVNAIRLLDDGLIDGIPGALAGLRRTVCSECQDHLFIKITNGRERFYDDAAKEIRTEILETFPDTGEEIRAAGRCYALEEPAACVFHLMRAVEPGLEALAKHVLDPREYAEIKDSVWGTVIKKVEKEIQGRIGAAKKNEERRALAPYAALASQFRYFKDAWRNLASHKIVQFSDRKAKTVFDAVLGFLNELPEIPGICLTDSPDMSDKDRSPETPL